MKGSWIDDEVRAEFFELVDDVMKRTHAMRTLLSIYPCVVASRFFKGFSAQPRLAIVTKTLSTAAVDIIHFSVVFFSIFALYSFAAMILFGQELHEYSNFSRATNSVFRMLLSDFDWDRMNRVGRPQAGFIFWTFNWLVNLILLNMLLAIIMDVYTEVKGGLGSQAETLWSQVAEIYRRLKEVRAGNYLTLTAVLKALDATDLDEFDDEEDPGRLRVYEELFFLKTFF